MEAIQRPHRQEDLTIQLLEISLSPGISNYHISNVLFGASGLVFLSPGIFDLFSKEDPNLGDISFRIVYGLGYSAYQIYRNKKLESMESEQQDGEAIAIDFNLKNGIPMSKETLNIHVKEQFTHEEKLEIEPLISKLNPNVAKDLLYLRVGNLIEEFKKREYKSLGNQIASGIGGLDSMENKIRGTLKIAAVKAPGFGDRRKEMLEDIAVLTGGIVISEDKGHKLENATLEYLGKTDRVNINKENTIIIGGHGDRKDIDARLNEIKSHIETSTS